MALACSIQHLPDLSDRLRAGIWYTAARHYPCAGAVDPIGHGDARCPGGVPRGERYLALELRDHETDHPFAVFVCAPCALKLALAALDRALREREEGR